MGGHSHIYKHKALIVGLEGGWPYVVGARFSGSVSFGGDGLAG